MSYGGVPKLREKDFEAPLATGAKAKEPATEARGRVTGSARESLKRASSIQSVDLVEAATEELLSLSACAKEGSS